MNATQAENLRILIRHIASVGGNLTMAIPWPESARVGCAMCEARRARLVAYGPAIPTLSHTTYGLSPGRLFGAYLVVDGARVFAPTPAQWCAEPIPSKPDAFQAFMAKVHEPVISELEGAIERVLIASDKLFTP